MFSVTTGYGAVNLGSVTYPLATTCHVRFAWQIVDLDWSSARSPLLVACEFRQLLRLFLQGYSALLDAMLVSTAHVLFVFLLLLSDNRMVAAVCRHCHGGIPGCPGRHDNDDCTAYTGVAANVAALAVGATTALSVAKLLPLSMLRVFTRRALDILLTLTRRPPSGTPFDFTGKTPADILRAVADRAVDMLECGR